MRGGGWEDGQNPRQALVGMAEARFEYWAKASTNCCGMLSTGVEAMKLWLKPLHRPTKGACFYTVVIV